MGYYGLPLELVEKWLGMRLPAEEQWSSDKHSGGISITENNMVATHSGNYNIRGLECEWVSGARLYGGRDHVLITLRVQQRGLIIYVGVDTQDPANRNFYGVQNLSGNNKCKCVCRTS